MMLLVIRLRSVLIGLAVCFTLGFTWGCLERPHTMITTSVSDATPPPLFSSINNMLHLRAAALLNQHTEGLQKMYDLSAATGRWALEHEIRRVKYMQAWSEKRGLRLVEVSTDTRLLRTEEKGGSVWAYIIQSAGFGYVYLDDPEAEVHRFGIGTRHVMELTLCDGRWTIKRDWYIDPLDQDPDVPVIAATAQTVLASEVAFEPFLTTQRPAYQRAAAVEYANTYCGSAWGCGNDRRYNQEYRDYTGLGGDCTNFASQVLGDPNAGGLPKDSIWHYSGKGWKGAGSQAWVKAEAFARYLSYSGIARRVARGKYPHVAEIVSQLEPGDLIAYEQKGRIVHFSVITAYDSKGVALVNSHTVDRYQVPWDLGWDAKTVFWLFHIQDTAQFS
ncbi:MAG: hypothetical protein GX162_03575 [Firmicutes bacterium]|jgi:hypothetical protein|nr:hypothetical protein [Bacillota bacterium]